MRRFSQCVIVAWLTTAGPAGAQALEVEARALHGESDRAMALYVAGGVSLGLAAVSGAVGGLTLTSGDTISPSGFLLTFAVAPTLGAAALTLLSLAIGDDVALGLWSGALERPNTRESARAELSTAITAMYGFGIASVLVSGIVLAATLAVTRDGYYVIPVVTGGLGLATIFVAAGMDMGAGAFGGVTASVTPLADGALGSVRAAF